VWPRTKLAILDVRARDDQGRWLNIEMQTSVPGELPQRLAYYAANQYVTQMREGDAYESLTPSIGICVLDGLWFSDVPSLHLDFRMRSEDPPVPLCDSLQIHLLELPKYTPPSDNSVITNPIEMWVYFLQRASELTPQQVADRLCDEVFTEAAGVLEMIARSPRERELYEARLKMQRDEQSRIAAAKDQGHATGLEEGLEKGREEGREEGLEKGRLVGRVQLLENLLGLSESSSVELNSQTLAALSQMASDLQQRLRERG